MKLFISLKLRKEVCKENINLFLEELSKIDYDVREKRKVILKQKRERDERIMWYLKRESMIRSSNAPSELKLKAIKNNTDSYMKECVYSRKIKSEDNKIFYTREEVIKNAKMHYISKEINKKNHRCNIITNNSKCIFCNEEVNDSKVNFELDMSNELIIYCIRLYTKIAKEYSKYEQLEFLLEILNKK